jgi:hypothetical protein
MALGGTLELFQLRLSEYTGVVGCRPIAMDVRSEDRRGGQGQSTQLITRIGLTILDKDLAGNRRCASIHKLSHCRYRLPI